MRNLTENQLSEIRHKLANGERIDAVRLCREYSGTSLAGAEEAVAAMTANEVGNAASVGMLTESQEAKLRGNLESGRKIEAVKQYREYTGAGLKESKEFVESLGARSSKSPSGKKISDRPNVTTGGCGSSVFLLSVAGAIVYLLF
ncbi:MAG: hypothetical protein P1U86_16560 [Verrucomicrobiales bacterium]|nr:hypothetical protein [Verrucomicrobiales bacterium]